MLPPQQQDPAPTTAAEKALRQTAPAPPPAAPATPAATAGRGSPADADPLARLLQRAIARRGSAVSPPAFATSAVLQRVRTKNRKAVKQARRGGSWAQRLMQSLGVSKATADTLAQASTSGRSISDLEALWNGKPAHVTADEVVALMRIPAKTIPVPGIPAQAIPVADILGLLNHAAAPTVAEVKALVAAGRRAADLGTLTNPPYGLAGADAIALGVLRGRTMPDLQVLAAAVAAGLAPGRTVADLVALARRGSPPILSPAQVVALVGIPQRADLIALADIVPQLLAGRVVTDIVALANLGAPAHRFTAADILAMLGPAGIPTAFLIADVQALVAELPLLSGAQIVEVAGWLHPSLGVAPTIALCQLMHGGPLTGLEIHSIFSALNTAGASGQQIDTEVRAHWARFTVGDPTDITTPSALPTPGGTRILTATMLKEHLVAALTAGTALAGLGAALELYPTGQDPRTRTENQLWTDCALANALPRLAGGGVAETAGEAAIRQRLALNELMTTGRFGPVQPDIVQQIFAHNDGQTARAIRPPAGEDTLGVHHGAHIVDRHVLNNTGTIGTVNDLIRRALLSQSPASAFAANPGGAQTAMQAAFTALNWPTVRRELRAGRTYQRTVGGINPAGTRVDRNGGGGPYNATALPPYFHNAGTGTRPVAGENYVTSASWGLYTDGFRYLLRANGAWRTPYVCRTGFVPGAPMSTITNNPASVTLRIIPEDVVGGFFIHSAWPG